MRSLDDGEIDVGLEQRDADLPQDLADFGVAEATAAAKAREDSFETIGQGLEHGPDQVTRAASASSERVDRGVRRTSAEERGHELGGSNGDEVRRAFAEPDELDRQAELGSDREHDRRPLPCRRAW